MEGLRGLREVRGEGKGLKGMAYGTRPVDLNLPLARLSYIFVG